MLRYLLTTVALLELTALSSAQFMPARSGGGGFGGGARSFGPAPRVNTVGPLPTPILPPINSAARGFAGGFNQAGLLRPGYPYPASWGGYGGWSPYYVYGDSTSAFTNNIEVNLNGPVVVQGGQPEPRVELSGETTAVLTLSFPAAAEIWVDGKKGPGEPNDEW